jgi:hypothetical protein
MGFGPRQFISMTLKEFWPWGAGHWRPANPFSLKSRARRADGKYRWMLHRDVALVDDHENMSGGSV